METTIRRLEAKLYAHIRYNDIEYTAVAYTQIKLGILFPLEEGFVVLPEFSPDGGRARMDHCLAKDDPESQRDLRKLAIIEVKRLGAAKGDVKAAKDHAERKALAAMARENIDFLYIMTVKGPAFRLWDISDRTVSMRPWFGKDDRGLSKEYLDFNSEVGLAWLQEFVHRIKNHDISQLVTQEPSAHYSQQGPSTYAQQAPSTYYSQPGPSTYRQQGAQFQQHIPAAQQPTGTEVGSYSYEAMGASSLKGKERAGPSSYDEEYIPIDPALYEPIPPAEGEQEGSPADANKPSEPLDVYTWRGKKDRICFLHPQTGKEMYSEPNQWTAREGYMYMVSTALGCTLRTTKVHKHKK